MPSTTLHQQITEQIVAQLKSGGLPPWRRPWALDPNCGSPLNLLSIRTYRGINVLILGLASMTNGYRSRWWGTYRQIQEMGGQVRRGEKATRIIFFRPITKTRLSDTGKEVEETFPIMREFCVFNAEQTSLDFLRAGRTVLDPSKVQERYEQFDAVVAATGARIVHGGNEAFYSRGRDYIQMPLREQFNGSGYYQTLSHELTHWSEPRLNWDRANEGYALGELIAELGGCFLCGELGIPSGESLGNHAAYLQHWLSGMAHDPKFIFKAAAQASKAVELILSFSRTPVEEPEAVLAE